MSLSPRTTTSALTVGIIAVTALTLTSCGLGMQDLPLGRDGGGDSYSVNLQLAGADGLVIGADVRNGQKVIGRIASLDTDVVGARVTLSLNSATQLPENVSASVELPSALGNPFIRILVPQAASGTVLRNGDTIPESRTEIGPQVESALATLGTVLNGSGLDQLDTVVGELNTAFAGRSGTVRSLTDTLISLTSVASTHQSDFEQAIDAAGRISSQFAGQHDAIDQYLDSVPKVVDILVGQKNQISSLLNSTAQLATNANAILSAAPNGLDGMLVDAETVVATLDSFKSEMGQTLVNMNGMLENFNSSIHGNYLVFDGALDVPGTIDKLLTGGISGTAPAIAPAGTLDDLLRGGIR